MSNTENVIWEGRPSQWTNFWYFTIWSFTIIVPIWRYLVVKNTVYELTNERLLCHSGVLNKTTEELELYRVKDVKEYKPLLYRLVGLGNVYVSSSDKSTPITYLHAIKDSKEVRENIRKLSDTRRDLKRVREID